jgi:hypothetical protein
MKKISLFICLTLFLLLSIAAPCFSAVLNVRAFVDGRSQVVMKGSDVWWHHVEYSAPGWSGGTFLPTSINGSSWTPVWPSPGDNSSCNCDSSHYTPLAPAMAAAENTIQVTKIAGRGTAVILQQPSAANDYTAIIEIYDEAGGADWHELDITYSDAVSASIPAMNPWGMLLFALLITGGTVYLFKKKAIAF